MRNRSAPGLMARLVNTPIMADMAMLRFYFGYLAKRDGMTGVLIDGEEQTDILQLTAAGKYRYDTDRKLLAVPDTGIAVIEIDGSLAHKMGGVFPSSGMTGYDGIQTQIERALADPQTKGILLDINSGGGEVAGAFDTADAIYAAAQVKPVWAIADEAAYSAAYLLASQATRITTPRTGGVGSVGVIALHIDWSQYMEKQGAKVSIIKAGAQKAALSPMEPLSDEARAKVQGDVDMAYQMLIETVARGGGLDPLAVRGTEAATFAAPEALAIGFIDAIQPANDTYEEFAQYLASRGRIISLPATYSSNMESDMTQRNATATPPAPAAPPVEEPAAAPATAPVAPPAAAVADPVLAERNRVIAIQTMAQPGEEALANDLVATGASTDVAALAFRKARQDAREASAAVRRTETPRPVPSAAGLAPGAPAIDPSLPLEHRCRLEWDRDAGLQAEFGGHFDSYRAYKKAEADGRLRNMGAFARGKGQPIPGTAA